MIFLAAIALTIFLAGTLAAARLGHLAERAAAEAAEREQILRNLRTATGPRT